MSWRVAKSLTKLRDQINEAHPNRDKKADGTIGDDAHKAQGSASDHNAWFNDKNGVGVVTALDITHDVPNGVDIDKLSDELIASRDPRIKYVIANGLIAGPYTAWKWQPSSGHYNHIHISVNTNNYDDESKWNIGKGKKEMVTQTGINYLFLTLLGRDCDKKQAKELMKVHTFDSLEKWIKKLPEYKQRAADAKSGKLDFGKHLARDFRPHYVPSNVKASQLKPGTYLVK